MKTGPAGRQRRARPPPAPWRTRSGSRARCPSPRRSSASPARGPRRRRRSGRTGSTASLTRRAPGHRVLGQVRGRRARSPSISRQAIFASGIPIALLTNGHRARGARVGLDHVELAGGDRVLDVDQPDDAELERDAASPARGSSRASPAPSAVRRQHAGRVAGVDPGLLDVLHDAADPRRPRRRTSASTSTSIASSRKRSRRSRGRRRATLRSRYSRRPSLGVDDLHRAAAEHVATAGRAAGSRRARRRRAPPRRSAPSAYGGCLVARAGRAGAPKRPRSSARSIASTASRAAGRRPRRGPRRASAASGRRTGRSRPRAARSRRPRARPRAVSGSK